MSTLVVDAIEDSSAIAKYNITLGTEQASTSGTSIDFTSIPSGVKRITVMLQETSGNGTSNYLIQIGDSGGVETTGYDSVCEQAGTGQASTAGFILTRSHAASQAITGFVVLSLKDGTTEWVSNGVVQLADARAVPTAGGKTLSAELDRVRVTHVNGTDAFNAGTINIQYEF